jgi:hypothetical protein
MLDIQYVSSYGIKMQTSMKMGSLKVMVAGTIPTIKINYPSNWNLLMMIFRQKKSTSSYPLYFVMWSDLFPNGADKESAGGWGRTPRIASSTNFKLELIK